MTPTKEAVLKALGTVQEPDLGQDLVTLNMIRNLDVSGEKVSFTVMLTTPACPLRSPAPDAFASVVARLFVFPDGRVAGATPIAAAYDGQEPVFIDCAMDLVRAWQFPPFTGPGFIVVDAPLKRGIDPRVR